MQNISLKNKNILVPILILLALAVMAYFYYRGGDTEMISLDQSADTGPLGQDILILAEKLNILSIDASVFSSVLFTTLVDWSLPLLPEPQGRANPFALIGTDAGSATTLKTSGR
ncbi:MAG: hypothetical protein A3H52_01065 [Candidatus Zambryskibacteria bacterium RIFCSPLOWO2_02_FULL_39_26]|uniref:Uncharacterized protein n=1 Tax=Candidatus Zambryskibacteria bacterium RIFCSPLOWO2_12_FULL_39_23 TaxID=1802776 RepID=A0A1G2URC4_9BACT|nr:MAG: hypothetical protein A2W51_01150 [Candidatus Zambryskibacteria bacterium RIFCSPHIGHO2_02_39_10]OHA99348.1 MAG: hypothetical protein A3E59_02475 [Candidatus Zambryskibacteria bacterium RIFCSPHIGHO2_12_FULL_39_47]OHB09984.1 MAG: hypothetical protein A3H52_01065 [Candidatus Zambryskibacteria bacterium RIFCSPLOWO2_02_FULL_39_26]OHB11941.1 MAG: hypothetical protein A3G99_02655 [Candidatus Zambryskibacteria bacterium RIFCSPLOWO2_12_FULL_39_23]